MFGYGYQPSGYDALGDMNFAPMGQMSFLHPQLMQGAPLPKQSQPLLGGAPQQGPQQPAPQGGFMGGLNQAYAKQAGPNGGGLLGQYAMDNNGLLSTAFKLGSLLLGG
jgi:hypothetical protein